MISYDVSAWGNHLIHRRPLLTSDKQGPGLRVGRDAVETVLALGVGLGVSLGLGSGLGSRRCGWGAVISRGSLGQSWRWERVGSGGVGQWGRQHY